MRVMIVDDEPLARRGIALRLAQHDDVEVVGECSDGVSAIEEIVERDPDVVFLDIQMPGVDGFGVLRALEPERRPLVVFITAYGEHAVRAYEVDAVDYLVKPLQDDRVEAALLRVRARLQKRGTSRARYRAYFSVRTGTRIHIVAARDIIWIAAAGDYAELHVRDGTRLLRRSLNVLEQELDPEEFMRIHRSRIVRVAAIRELRPLENREYVVKLADGSEHRASRTHADRLHAWLGRRDGAPSL
jgi:two-component system, LytTR family, response regulator